MEKQDIIEQLKGMTTAADLAFVLNSIKKSEFGAVRYDISAKMLGHFSSDSIAPKRYRKFHIRKKSGGLREIKAPCRQLDLILTCVNIMLKALYEPSESAMGFTSGRSVLTNAQVHVGHNYVFNIDLKDFFPSIVQARVWKRLQLPPFNFTREVANVVAGLCCSRDDERDVNVLPQGSPASPLLTNAVCDKLDRRMRGVAKRFGLHYSRYADDMTFSSMHNVYQEDGEFRAEIRKIIAGQGFRMNEAKTRLQKKGGRQEVTGLTVNAIANVSRQYVSDLRWILHVWEKEGYAKAYALFYPKYKHDKGYIKRGEPVMENVIGGKLNYLRMVRGAGNEAYKKLAARFAALQQGVSVDPDIETTNDASEKRLSYEYVQPYSLKDFQSLFHATVTLEVSREGKLIGKCVIDGREKVLAVSKSTQQILCPDLAGKTAGDAVTSPKLSKCYVTLCHNRGKNFWLITRFEPQRSYTLGFRDLSVNPESLLTLWEKGGFDAAAEEFGLFMRFGRPGESILDWNPLSVSGDSDNIDRGEIKNEKDLLLNYFLNHRHLTLSSRRRLIKLLTPVVLNVDSEVDADRWLSLWEKNGIEAAVKAWKEANNEEIATRNPEDSGTSGNDAEIIAVL